MAFITALIWLLVGFVLLVKGADYLITGAAGLAAKLKISPMVIGLTVLAFGTSLPELVVNIFASMEDKGAITVGNVVGSNIANIGLILGLTAIIRPLSVKKEVANREMSFMVFTGITLLILFGDKYLGGGENILSRLDAVVLLALFIMFIYSLVKIERKDVSMVPEEKKDPFEYLILITIVGLVGISFGGDLVTDNASAIARMAGISEVLVGLTIVSFGTSLPELAASVTAARKGYPGMAVGNIVGSNIFNTLLVLGVSAVVRPILFVGQSFVDLLVMIGFAVFLLLISITKRQVSRKEGVALLVSYVVYISLIVWRG